MGMRGIRCVGMGLDGYRGSGEGEEGLGLVWGI